MVPCYNYHMATQLNTYTGRHLDDHHEVLPWECQATSCKDAERQYMAKFGACAPFDLESMLVLPDAGA